MIATWLSWNTTGKLHVAVPPSSRGSGQPTKSDVVGRAVLALLRIFHAVLLDDLSVFLAGAVSLAAVGKHNDYSAEPSVSLDNTDQFGRAVANISDLNDDLVIDIAVGAPHDDDGGPDRGAIYVLFLNKDGNVKQRQKISNLYGGFDGELQDDDYFGWSITSPGDVNGDQIAEIAVGAPHDEEGGWDQGAVWMLFMRRDGTVASHQKINNRQGYTSGGSLGLKDYDYFGTAVAGLDRVNTDDNVPDIAVGAAFDDDGGRNRGAVYILFLNAQGKVKNHQKISDTSGNFGFGVQLLSNDVHFGWSVARLGRNIAQGHECSHPDECSDIRNAAVTIAVGAPHDDDGGQDRGAVWVVFIDSNGNVIEQQKISSSEGGATGSIGQADHFGRSVSGTPDLNGDNIDDLLVGAPFDDTVSTDAGAFWILLLKHDGTVKQHRKVTSTHMTSETLASNDQFGWSIAGLSDIDGDSFNDFVVGSPLDDDGGTDRGAVYVIFSLDPTSVMGTGSFRNAKLSSTSGSFANTATNEFVGLSLASAGDIDANGVQDLVLGFRSRNSDQGGAYILLMRRDGTVQTEIILHDSESSDFSETLPTNAQFGGSVAGIRDIDGDNIPDIAIGAPNNNELGNNRGMLYILLMNSDGTVKRFEKLWDTDDTVDFSSELAAGDNFGESVDGIEDVNGDGIPDVVVGAPGTSSGGTRRGAFWVILLDSSAKAKSFRKMSPGQNGFNVVLTNNDELGKNIAGIGDVDADNTPDLAVATDHDFSSATVPSAIYLVMLQSSGSAKKVVRIISIEEAFSGMIGGSEYFYRPSPAHVGDVNGDEIPDMLVGSPHDGADGRDRGACWILYLNRDGTIKSYDKIGTHRGLFSTSLRDNDRFGHSVASMGDMDNDGNLELAIGSPNDADGGSNHGAVWLVSMADATNPRKESRLQAHVERCLYGQDEMRLNLWVLNGRVGCCT